MKDLASLEGRRILITGASAGLGAGIARGLADIGAAVVLSGRNREALDGVAQSLTGIGHCVEPFDLNRTDEIPAWLKDVAGRDGALHGIVHCAGLLLAKPLKMLSATDWEQAFRVNVTAGAMLAKGLRQRQVMAEEASLVFLSSVMGLTGQPGQVLYSSTKGALIAMTRSLALELARDRIRVNSVAPAVVDTGMTEQLRRSMGPEQFSKVEAMHPLGVGTPADVAYAVAVLLAPGARWITGTTVVIDGGYTAH